MNAPEQPSEVNLRLYPLYLGGVAFYAWMPVFFLYQAQRVSLPQVLQLESIYYITVVLLELPSGYFSDSWGRRATLRLASAALLASYLLFALSDTFWTLAMAQASLAVGLAFNSGTDTSFHLASLTEAHRKEEYAQQEARLSGLSLGLGALAALLGGALGSLDMRLAYLASGLGALVALLATLQMKPLQEERAQRAFWPTLRACLDQLRRRDLAWLFAFAVASTVINHVPYEFYQSYLEKLPQLTWTDGATPMVAGLHLMLAQLLALPAARLSHAASQRLGLAPHLLLSLLWQGLLILAMAWWLHPLVGLLLITRSIPHALQEAPLRAHVTPHIQPQQRATYLSLQSLAGRLGFGALLLSLSFVGGEGIAASLWYSAGVAACALLALALTSRRRWS